VTNHILGYLGENRRVNSLMLRRQKVDLQIEEASTGNILYLIQDANAEDLCRQVDNMSTRRKLYLACNNSLSKYVNSCELKNTWTIIPQCPFMEKVQPTHGILRHLQNVWSCVRLWTLNKDAPFLSRTLWCISVTPMDSKICAVFHKHLSSIRIKWIDSDNEEIGTDFQYEIVRSYNLLLRSSMFVLQMPKEELVFNTCRLSTMFSPNDSMYCDLYENDDNQSTPPSQQLIDLYASLRVTLRQWFARMCIFLDLPIRFANYSPILPLYNTSPYCDQFKDMFDVNVSSPWEPE
jgi:hypothetical protein